MKSRFLLEAIVGPRTLQTAMQLTASVAVYSLWLWRDLYNFTRVHYSLLDETPAMALGLTKEVWPVLKYVLYPVHVSDLQHRDWAEQRNGVLESALDVYKRNKTLPIS